MTFTISYGFIYSALILIASVLSMILIYKTSIGIRKHLLIKKAFMDKKQSVKDMKERGDFHKWIDLPVGTKTYKVCETTGYMPEKDGFLPLSMVKMHKERLELEKKYEVFKEERIKDMAKTYNVEKKSILNMIDEVHNIKKDFSVMLMSDLIKDLKLKEEDE